ncbi:MAG: hypothetical protein K2K21_16260 [Lachnospiraceae bacterium]|nr:hypothetical protein [Lachnospiraceae bacterium]
MKKWVIVLALSILCSMSACSNKNTNNISDSGQNDVANEVSDESGSDEVDANNRTIIAEAVGIEENDRNMRFILSTLNTISAGQIQSAEVVEEDGEKVINLVAEDGTNYCIYLSGSGSVEAVKNLDTGEWSVKSER